MIGDFCRVYTLLSHIMPNHIPYNDKPVTIFGRIAEDDPLKDSIQVYIDGNIINVKRHNVELSSLGEIYGELFKDI
jgi:hypothetical protein